MTGEKKSVVGGENYVFLLNDEQKARRLTLREIKKDKEALLEAKRSRVPFSAERPKGVTYNDITINIDEVSFIPMRYKSSEGGRGGRGGRGGSERGGFNEGKGSESSVRGGFNEGKGSESSVRGGFNTQPLSGGSGSRGRGRQTSEERSERGGSGSRGRGGGRGRESERGGSGSRGRGRGQRY
ncbi:MAG: hypothetical protein Solumvirus2_2 [Solumvirus sp.]|uniref:Uncharacterized protein n=1 Tax=Solumvirus sp. TaxID=2487773 RepID=A0A3G5AG64_9VIRU|nr:MAG: hypothetical protein Solumvirus2_2 [Solumvirus sp.]